MRKRTEDRRAWLTALVLCMGVSAGALVLAPQQAYAQDETAEVVTDISNRGIAKYKAGEYDEAIKLFKQAYELEQIPNLLYNIARCYEKQKKYKEAIEYYEKFVVAPDVESDARQTALSRAENLREVLKASGEISDNNTNGNGNSGNGNGSNGNGGQSDGGGGKSKAPAFAVLGLGVAGLAVGGTFGFLAGQDQSTFETAATPEEKRDAKDRGETRALIADIGYASGAVLTTVGLIMVIRRSRSDTSSSSNTLKVEDPQRAMVAPWFGRDGGGLQMELRF